MAVVEGAVSHHQFGFCSSQPVTMNLPLMDLSSVTSQSPPRPASALERGVKITEFKDITVNPEPVILEESELLLEDYLSPRKLRALTGMDDLEEVQFLEMKVDTRDTSLGNFGSHLPNLTQLKLSNSIITSARDLGSSLNNLKVLWMARCGLEELDGLSTLSNLEELYLAYNEVCDISPCSMIENLKIVDLEGNNIDEISQVEFLAMCQNLQHLTLEGNPICMTPYPDQAAPDYDYREAVKKIIPHLRYLDDESLAATCAKPRKSATVFDDDWKLIEELMEEGTLAGEDEVIEVTARPTTAIRPTTGYRPGSALKQNTGVRPQTSQRGTILRPGTASRPLSARPGSARPGSGERPTSAGPTSVEDIDEANDASDLTCGELVCGNPSKALRSRQKKKSTSSSSVAKVQEPVQPKVTPAVKPSYRKHQSLENDEDVKIRQLFSELKSWKVEHERKRQQIEATKAPQVLRIDHDDTMSLSGEESVDSDLEDIDPLSGLSAGPPSARSSTDSDSGVATATPSSWPTTPATPVTPNSPDYSGARLKDSSSLYNRRGRPARLSDEPSSATKLADRRRRRFHHDESFEAKDDVSPTTGSPETSLPGSDRLMRSASPLLMHKEEDGRPHSGSSLGSRNKFRLEPMGERNQPKAVDRNNPVIRTSPHSPEARSPLGQRAGNSPAAQGQPQLTRIRKGQLAKVQLLPSKINSSFSK